MSPAFIRINTVHVYVCMYVWYVCNICMNVYVTGPAKIGHICTQNLALFLNFNLQYLLKCKCYYNEIFMPYS